MSIYPGDPVQQNYAYGVDEGHAWGEQDVVLGLGTMSEWLRCARDDVRSASTRESRAFALGYLRGYRDAVRTNVNGRWGL